MSGSGCTHVGEGRILNAGGDTTHVVIRYIYRPHDPLAVTLRFLRDQAPAVEWTFARDLLGDAMNNYACNGDGDVTLTRIYPNTLMIALDSNDGSGACLIATTDTAAQLLVGDSLSLVPREAELEAVAAELDELAVTL